MKAILTIDFGGDYRSLRFPSEGTLAIVGMGISGTYPQKLAGERHRIFSLLQKKHNFYPTAPRKVPNAPWSAGSYWEEEVTLSAEAIADCLCFSRAQAGDTSALETLILSLAIDPPTARNARYWLREGSTP